MTDVEWGYAQGESDLWSLRHEGSDRMLCGQKVDSVQGGPGWFPVEQPEHPRHICPPCVWALVAEHRAVLDQVTAVRRLLADKDHLLELPDKTLIPVGWIRQALGEVSGG